MKKILIIDDVVSIVNLLRFILQENGYEVVVAQDAMQGIMIAHREKPDLILLDVMLPAGSGPLVYQRLKESVNTSGIPVIFATGLSQEDVDKKFTEEMKKVPLLKKPFKPAVLLETIEQMLKKNY